MSGVLTVFCDSCIRTIASRRPKLTHSFKLVFHFKVSFFHSQKKATLAFACLLVVLGRLRLLRAGVLSIAYQAVMSSNQLVSVGARACVVTSSSSSCGALPTSRDAVFCGDASSFEACARFLSSATPHKQSRASITSLFIFNISTLPQQMFRHFLEAIQQLMFFFKLM